jgi:hypothetical protein
MRSLVVLIVAAVMGGPAIGVPADDPPSATLSKRTFLVEAGSGPQPYSVACQPGEELIGGGFATQGSGLRVMSSYPNGGTWTVEAANTNKVPIGLEVQAACLAASPGRTTIVEQKGEAPKAAVQCPDGTVVAGGGFLTSAQRVQTTFVTGSHPLGDNGWGIEAEIVPGASAPPGTQDIEVFGVCLPGAKLVSADPTNVNFPGPPFVGHCAGTDVPTSVGFELIDGRMLPYAVQRATPTELAVNADAPVTMRAIVMCVTWPPAPVTAGTNWPLVAGIGLLVLLVIVAVYWLRSRRVRRARAGAGIDVEVRSERAGFGLEHLREIP